jgi:hypothetical protein
MYNDYLLGSGNCVMFVQHMENCSWSEALSILNERYELGYLCYVNKTSRYQHKPVITNFKPLHKIEKWIDIKIRPWERCDMEYWSKYEITLATLQYFNVYPIQKFWINNIPFKTNPLAYAYYYEDRVFKIYQPESNSYKWVTNIKKPEIYQGATQLEETGDVLFITSSLKDVMVLYEAGFSAIAPHTEHQILSDALFSHYSSKWDLVTVLYDNDSAGILHAKKMTEKFGIKSLILPESDTKDPSDFVEKYDLTTLKEWILNNI